MLDQNGNRINPKGTLWFEFFNIGIIGAAAIMMALLLAGFEGPDIAQAIAIWLAIAVPLSYHKINKMDKEQEGHHQN